MFPRTEDGFSLVEVLIAMFLFAVISLAVLPLLISGISLSTVNRDVVAATAVANDRIAQLRDDFPTSATTVKTCDQLVAAVAALSQDDANNPNLELTAVALPDVDAGSVCPIGATNYPRSVRVLVTVTDSDGAIAQIPTRFSVGSKS